MNNAKLWLVVKPTVGIPIFLGAVAVGSFAVHVAVLSKTNWYSDYLVGQELGSSAAIEAPVKTADGNTGNILKSSTLEMEASGKEAVITLPDGRKATVIFKEIEDPLKTASAEDQLLTQ